MKQKNLNFNSKNSFGRHSLWDRIVQITLLLLIAGGLVFIVTTLRSGVGGSSGAGGPGRRRPDSSAPADAAVSGSDAPGTTSAGIQTEIAVPVEVASAGRETIREYIRVNGDVLADRSVTIYPDASGKVVERLVSVGQYVRRDQHIAVVDPSQPGQRYSPSPILSTISGTVTATNVQVGDTVNQQTGVATVGDLSRLEIVTYVPERYVASVANGMVADISFEAFPGEIFPGRVVQVSPVLDTQSRTVEVKLVLDNADSRVKVGMFASISLIIAEARDIIAVPAIALTSHYDQPVVYVIDEAGIARRRDVTVGLRSRDLVQITSGLADGENVITAGIGNVTDGTPVRVVNMGPVQ